MAIIKPMVSSQRSAIYLPATYSLTLKKLVQASFKISLEIGKVEKMLGDFYVLGVEYQSAAEG